MQTFEYIAKDTANNREVKSTVQADSEQSAAQLITAQGLAPLEIKLKGTSKGLLGGFFGRIKTKDRVVFTRQLSTLIGAGLPLSQSLRNVAEQTSNKNLAKALSEVLTSVEGGKSLADSMAQHPKVFNNVYVSLVAAGESSGTMDEALERIADQQEKDAEIASKVKGALVYPIIVLAVILLVVIFMLTTVLPQVELLYKDLNQELPFLTAVMIGIAHAVINYWYVGIIMLVIGIISLRRYARTDPGKATFDTLKLRFPLFGILFKKMYMARFCRTGGTLLKTAVPMLEMLRITADAVDNVHVRRSIDKATVKVKGGRSLGDALLNDDNFLNLVPQMIKIGEQSGAVDTMLSKAADFYEHELDNEIKTISTTIEPVLMVVLALIAGLMVGAILFPIYGLVGNSGSVSG